MIRRARLLVLAAICALVVVGLASPAQGATVTPQQLYDLRAEAPYVHSDIIGRTWIYGATSTNNSGFRNFRSTLLQHYGGSWHPVGWNSGSGVYTQRTIASVYCGGKRTPYSFVTLGEVQYGNAWYPTYSRVVTLNC